MSCLSVLWYSFLSCPLILSHILSTCLCLLLLWCTVHVLPACSACPTLIICLPYLHFLNCACCLSSYLSRLVCFPWLLEFATYSACFSAYSACFLPIPHVFCLFRQFFSIPPINLPIPPVFLPIPPVILPIPSVFLPIPPVFLPIPPDFLPIPPVILPIPPVSLPIRLIFCLSHVFLLADHPPLFAWLVVVLSAAPLVVLRMAILSLIYIPATSDRGIIYHDAGGGGGLFPVSLGSVYPPNSHPLPAGYVLCGRPSYIHKQYRD